MKSMIIAAAFTIAAAMTANVSAAPVPDSGLMPNKEILIYMPDETPAGIKELTCYGCLSTETGRPRTNYVQPHVRSNGTYVQGYWRS